MKKVGLALGAGSTKGFAHVGVLQVLEKAHIPIDLLSGCSMGAIIGAIYAAGTDLSMLEKFILSVNPRDYKDFALPTSGGLLHGERLSELIRLLTHNFSFSETRIPFCCVATDMSTGELVTLEQGKLYESVRASMSIPGVFTPVELNGHTLADGGLVDRVPCQALRDRGADLVIGVDVGYHGGRVEHGSNPYVQINRMIEIMQWEITKLKAVRADVRIEPDVLFLHGVFDTSNTRACIEEGRRAATTALPQILELLQQNGIPLKQ